MRKLLGKPLGRRGASIRVFVEDGLVRVYWSRKGKREMRSWPDSREHRAVARAFAEGMLHEWESPAPPQALTFRELWEAYAEASFPSLRPRSRELYTAYWRKAELYFGAHASARDLIPASLQRLRGIIAKQGLALSTAKHVISTVKGVYAWADQHRLLSPNPIAGFRFKIGKEERPVPVEEYTRQEFDRLLAQFDATKPLQWRAWLTLMLCGWTGARQNAVLHLQWGDVTEEEVIFRARWDKMGREWRQPLYAPLHDALVVARTHREREGYTGKWILFSESATEVYTIQAFWWMLKTAERKAGIAHRRLRAGHGFRRMFAGDVAAATNDPLLAIHAIGDTDLTMAGRYLHRRDERRRVGLEKLADAHYVQPTRNAGEGAESGVTEVVGEQGVTECARLDSNQELADIKDSETAAKPHFSPSGQPENPPNGPRTSANPTSNPQPSGNSGFGTSGTPAHPPAVVD